MRPACVRSVGSRRNMFSCWEQEKHAGLARARELVIELKDARPQHKTHRRMMRVHDAGARITCSIRRITCTP
jgi:hypothetical protein